MVEKYSATQTKVATKISTTTKVLLALLIVGSAAGMFAILSTLNPKQKVSIYNNQTIAKDAVFATVLGATEEEQFMKISKNLGVPEGVIEQCIKSNGENCPEQIRGIVGTSCVCSESCWYEANLCGSPCNGQSCTVSCSGLLNVPYTLTGTCRKRPYIKIFGDTIYF